MLGFGDVIYRPCLSYHGKKNFINTQIIKEIMHRPDGDYILSYDVFRQSWTDKIEDLGGNIFVDKQAAHDKLIRMIASK